MTDQELLQRRDELIAGLSPTCQAAIKHLQNCPDCQRVMFELGLAMMEQGLTIEVKKEA